MTTLFKPLCFFALTASALLLCSALAIASPQAAPNIDVDMAQTDATDKTINADQTIDYAAEITAIEHALSRTDLSFATRKEQNLALADALMMDEQYEQGAEILEYWIGDWQTVPQQKIEQLIAAWIKAENYHRALPWAERLFDRAEPKERKFHNLLIYLYIKTDQAQKISAYPPGLIEGNP